MRKKLGLLAVGLAVLFLSMGYEQNVAVAELTANAMVAEESREGGEIYAVEEIVAEQEEVLNATEYSYGDWTYTLSYFDATITGYTGSSTEIVIPSKVDGYDVTGISSYAFSYSNMTKLTIPEGITSIDYKAFWGCQYLQEINFNAQNCKIDSGDYIFENIGAKSGGVKIVFGSDVEKIPDYLFYYDDEYAHITSVVMSDTIKSIGNYAFYGCNDLQEVVWGKNIETIGSCSFSYTPIKKVEIPVSVTSMDYKTFWGCQYLQEISFNAQNCKIDSGDYIFENIGAKSGGVKIVFGSDVEKIPDYLFYYDDEYAHITSVVMSDTIKSIGNYAFYGCNDLQEVVWGKNIETIGSCSFSYTPIKKVEIPVSVTSIGYKAFYNCKNLQTIEYNAKGCKKVDYDTFANAGRNASYLSVIFGPLVEVVPQYMFYVYDSDDYAAITGVEISASVKTISSYAFSYCPYLSEITIPPNVTSIGSNAFYGSGLKEGTVYCVKGSTANNMSLYPSGTTIKYIAKQFYDVDATTWQYAPSKYVYDRGIMTGKGTATDGTTIFQPNANLTRAEFAQILYSAERKPAISYTRKFSDVANGQWYTNAILWAAEKGIVSGYTNGKYGVNDVITREQLAAILYKYAQYKGYDTNAGDTLSGFSDINKISSWSKTQMQWAVNHGVMSGKGIKLDPTGTATRAECAAMLRTFMVTFEE